MNLMINAVQAMPEGGDLAVVLERGTEGAIVSIRDTGIGIPHSDLERIFDPFYTTKDSGTGLGLVIASNIMQANGGYITVESEPGKGSTFRLCFPQPKEKSAEVRSSPAVCAAA
jgi:signal transduction histidine kinase